MAIDPCFALDNFHKPKLLSESQTIAYNILTILFGKPGFLPSQPEIGMNIHQYFYTFADSFDCEVIKGILITQCSDMEEVIKEGMFNVYQSIYNNQPLLVFVIPVFIDRTASEIVLGVSTTASGELIFNYNFEKNQTI